MKKLIFAVLSCLGATSFATIDDDYTRTDSDVSTGLKYVKWVKKSDDTQKAHALVFDLSTGRFAFRSCAGDGEKKATVQGIAESLKTNGITPIAGINVGCFVNKPGDSSLDGWGCIISDGQLAYKGYVNGDGNGDWNWAPERNNYLMELADGSLAIGKPVREGAATAFINSPDDITYDGKRIMDCNMLNWNAGPSNQNPKGGIIVKDGVYCGSDTANNYPRPLYGLGENKLVLFVSENGYSDEHPGHVKELGGDGKDGPAPLEEECAAMMMSLGCTTVGAGDGGGSASLWLNDPEKKFTGGNVYSFVNRPEKLSGPRPLPDAFFVVEKSTTTSDSDVPSKKVELTLNYTGATALADFPLLVRLGANSPEGFSYADAATGIRFTDANGVPLPFEVDTWNPNGESLVWVKVPSVTSSTKIYLYYGFAEAKDAEGSVWSDYTGVWHMTDLKDATANRLDATEGDNSSSFAAGAIGGAYTVNTKPRDSGVKPVTVSLANDDKKKAVDSMGTRFTVSFWLRSIANADWGTIIARKTVDTDSGWGIREKGDDRGGSDHYKGEWRILFDSSYAETGTLTYDPINANMNEWAKIDLVYADNSYTLYINGQNPQSGTYSQTVDNSTVAAIGFGGNTSEGNFNFRGQMDEIRLSAGSRSTDWVAAEYANQHGASFVTVGASANGYLPSTLAPDSPTPPPVDPVVEVKGYTRTEVEVTPGLKLVRWVGKNGNEHQKGHALKFDLTTGRFAFRSCGGNGTATSDPTAKAKFPAIAQILKNEGLKPLAGISAGMCAATGDATKADGVGPIIAGGKLIYAGTDSEPQNHNFLMELEDGSLVIGKPTRPDGKTDAPIQNASDLNYNGQSIRNCNMFVSYKGVAGLDYANGQVLYSDGTDRTPVSLIGLGKNGKTLILFASEGSYNNNDAPPKSKCVEMMVAEGCETVGEGINSSSTSLWLNKPEYTNEASLVNTPKKGVGGEYSLFDVFVVVDTWKVKNFSIFVD